MTNFKFILVIFALLALGGCVKKPALKDRVEKSYDKIVKNHKQVFDMIDRADLSENKKCAELIRMVPRVANKLPKFGYFDGEAWAKSADKTTYPYSFYAAKLKQDLRICDNAIVKLRKNSDFESAELFEALRERLSNIFDVVISCVRYREEVQAIKMLEAIERPVTHNVYIYK